MADRSKRRKKRAWGKPPVPAPSLNAGDIRGELRVIEYVGSKGGRRYYACEDVQTGERREVRADNLVSGRTKSAGRIKKERYKEHMTKTWLGAYTDINSIDHATLAQVCAIAGVDAHTGKEIKTAEPIKHAKPEPVVAAPTPTTPAAPKYKSSELVPYGLMIESDSVGRYHRTPKYERWVADGKPDPATWVDPLASA